MKSSWNKEDSAKKHPGYRNVDTAKGTKTSIGADQYVQPWEQQRKNVESARIDVPPTDKSDKTSLKTLESLLLHHSIQPCPFTFLTAVKRKLALGENPSACKKSYESEPGKEVSKDKMDFIKPLKVPDLKISPKADYSSRESLLSDEELSKKIEAVQREEMTLKSTDRVPRKLEFSSSSATSMLNYDNVEPLKIPDFAITKKKDLSRDSSREKENRSKRVKKDDLNVIKNKDNLQDISKWPKSQRHISRKEIADSILNKKMKSDRIIAHEPKENDVILKKSKPKNFTTSTIRKDDEKRNKYSHIPSVKSRKDKSLESRNRTSSSESIYALDKGTRLHEKILIQEGYKAMMSEINDRKYKDDSQIVNTSKTSDEQKYKSHSETRLGKHQNKSNSVKPIESLTRDQNKRIFDKQKSSSKTDTKYSSEISEDLTTALNSIASQGKTQSFPTELSSSIMTSKSKDMEKFSQSSNNRRPEEPKYSDTFSHTASTNSGSISTHIETKISQESSLSEKLLDPLRISFRDDSYSNVPEFADLVTPDINLMVRSKRRKQIIQGRENDSDYKDPKSSPSKNGQEIEESKLMHLKEEINLLDSFSESLRQVIDVERSKLSSADLKRHAGSSQNDHKDTESKRTDFESVDNKDDGKNKTQKLLVKVAEVQTQTANDIATQTDTTTLYPHGHNTSLVYSRVSADHNELPHVSLNSEDRYEDMDRVEDISLPSKMRTMSEISLHETTSSIKTETGTEISISTRGVTCSFNKYLDLEMAQLIKDERQRYDKIEMLFKSREKTLNDRTKKLVKLEEQKRALRDTGQDSRISSVKKKQRALLLKLQQEKDEMNRLKELHKIASQERKLMLQKQRDMFNPEMSTKNILNKLKRSADSQSPRRLSGPMKGYDIRSNSSISSLVDSDKSQFDRSQFDFKLNLSDIVPQRNNLDCSKLELDSSLKQVVHAGDNIDKKLSKFEASKQQKEAKLKYDPKTRKFEEKMPKSDLIKLKSHQYDLDAILKHGTGAVSLLHNDNCDKEDKSVSEHIRSESDVLMEEFTHIWRSQFPDFPSESLQALKEMHKVSSSKRLDKESIEKLQQQHTPYENKSAKRKGMKSQKSKIPQTESTSKSDDSHYYKRSKIDSEQHPDDKYQNSMLEEIDFNESQSSLQALLKHSNLLKERNQQLLQDIDDERNNIVAENSESPLSQKEEDELARGGNSARSQVSLTISHQSSNDSDMSYSRSVIIRSQQDHHPHHHRTGLKTSKKLEQILKAREATLVSRRNCVEEWIAWHARLRDEENRVARMEQAAYKLVSATAKALSHNDTTVSSDTSDVEGRIELLTQKLADRRLEMARLKKEARKQAKQRLRALEANLLNQIKKYDATIHDMRKKLETRRGTSKENEKLAIESKSVVDFKVPEIPIKKIQEIYKSSDLLRSKSDSDIISARCQDKDDKSKDDKTKSNEGETDSSKSGSTVGFKPLSSLYTVFDEEHESSEKSDYSVVHSYKTKSISEEIATQKSVDTEIQEIKRSSSQSSNISEEIPSDVHSVKSQTEHIQTAQTSEATQSQFVIEKIKDSTNLQDIKKNSNIEEVLTPSFDDTSLIFSRKLDHIQIHNKELNDDIHTLENDLKELTEMMSNFSKKTEEKNVKQVDQFSLNSKDIQKSTSKDISEELPTFESNVQTDDIDENLQSRVNEIISAVIPETDDLLSSIEELDVRAKSMEILDKVEKSMLSEHGEKSAAENIPTYLSSHIPDESNKVSSGANHYGTGTNTVSEVISVENDKENVLLNESQLLIDKTSQSPNGAISSHIESEYDFESEKISSAQIQESNSESVLLKMTERISIAHIASSKSNLNEATDNPDHSETEDKCIETKLSTTEEIITNRISSSQTGNKISDCNEIETMTEDKEDDNEDCALNKVNSSSFRENIKTVEPFIKTVVSDDWTLSDSFDIQQIGDKNSDPIQLPLEIISTIKDNKDEERVGFSDMEDSTMFIPKGESTNIQDTFVLKLDESSEPRIGIRSEEFNDILEIIERETKNDDEHSPQPAILNIEDRNLPQVDVKIDSPIECDLSVTVKAVDEELESIEEEIESKNENIIDDISHESSLDDKNTDLPKIEIGLKIELVDEENDKSKVKSISSFREKHNKVQITDLTGFSSEDRGSSDGEQLDNLIEVAEGKLATLEKLTPTKKLIENSQKPKTHVTVFLEKTFEVIKDPEYEDISEESLEVSEILDKTESHGSQKSKKFTTIPEKYVIKSKSDEVLRILDEISSKPSNNYNEENRDNYDIDDRAAVKVNSFDDLQNEEVIVVPSPFRKLNGLENTDLELDKDVLSEENSVKEIFNNQVAATEIKLDVQEEKEDQDVQEKEENSSQIISEISDVGALDTPRGVSEIDTDSPRDVNEDSRLDVDALDDDLLSGNSLLLQTPSKEAKTEFRTTPMGVNCEKDIEAMIDKLKASLEQPGLEVAELEAKLLQIENLQIELEIKKLEAEEVSYYVREIPNKPPPPYTPPGAVRLSSAHGSPSPPPAVIPTNVEELTAITEKATALIYKAKQSGEEVLALVAPPEICELAKDNSSDALKKDRRIYNTFLFDLCKEVIAEMYKAEYERPGPSWTKPNVKTKPAVKIAKNVDELNDYVSKEVATLFGFKTKLQRENMVMRWSRKRRDRVDELLAKEAQAEEKEWTKFHHDELAVKNELSMTILDTLILETTSCIKAAYTKKRKIVKT
ncbi:centrosome-associated protein 350 isoform X1 [Nasonia vitripennis]|uniref:Centrosome-associated protein 350 n=1 Tax=Nasonia vitripennis TaxID=7425 RepID=A0A7M7Q3R5_NASVI|nr:centrosome-associated protein 350 isoform X1 [Nasonia vitripennis]XP_031779181.1 centrosome-associated protein 350 isoform X1 [Nasonia vitripennis]XP_031779182.1 centrosome-associated protein 350 isoform X1 [Nasonia vitripennis]XP_031779183.1 centrosome-associated protein 350 isoform X1 [Nasonia vitripennis]